MGDSDDEFDKRRGRDKFRRERPDYQPERRDRGGWEDNRGRGEWRGKRDRNDSYGDYDRGRGYNRGSPPRYGSPPQAKRMKRDWEDFEHSGGSSWQPGGDMPPPNAAGPKGGADLDFPTQPPMMTFKSFLQQQEDNITDEEAIRKFNEYKLDFKKQQINEFFLQHKDEEWFRAKYHPEEYDKRKEETVQLIKSRCEVFAKLLQMDMVESGSCDVDKNSDVIKLLDAAVILMEGGTDFDLKSLEEEHKFYQEEKMISRQVSEAVSVKSDKVTPTEKPVEEKPKELNTSKTDDEGDGEIKDDDDDDEDESEKKTEMDTSDKPAAEEQDKEQEAEKPAAEETSGSPTSTTPTTTTTPTKPKDTIKENGIKKKKKKKRKTSEPGEEEDEDDDDDDSDSGSSESSDSEPEEIIEAKGDEPPPPGMEGSAPESYLPAATKPPKEASQEEEKEKDTAENAANEGEPRPRPLHKTQSIFLRNLAPNITKNEIEAMCRNYPGFLRLALQDPGPERKFFRRGWATFDRSVNIKEICWNLTNIRLKDCELGAIVNKELKQRVRPVNGITANRQVAKSDVKHCAKLVQNYDKRWKLWEEPTEKKDEEKMPRFGLISNNPVLKNITDYLVDEGSYEEEAYLGKSLDEPCNDSNPEVPLDRDDELLKVLDRMILYLRIVHSFDYYSCVEYPNEDEMPHRCGIMHGRGPPPLNRVIQGEIEDWIQHFDRKITPLEDVKVYLSEEEAKRLGKKDEEAECEKYIQGNTQELAKDKWLCPLSGKKFKGPDFVRKHIQNKHGEKLEEVKQEVSYFNNYLLDPKRPQLPEHPANKHGGVPSQRPEGYAPGPPPGAGYQPPPHHHSQGGYQMGGYNNYRGGGGPPMPFGGRGRGGPPMRGYHQSGGYNRGGYNSYHDKSDYRRDRSYDRNNYPPQRRDRSRPPTDAREILNYRDWDAPEEDPTV